MYSEEIKKLWQRTWILYLFALLLFLLGLYQVWSGLMWRSSSSPLDENLNFVEKPVEENLTTLKMNKENKRN